MKRRILGLLLVVCMVISLLPVVALADDAVKPEAKFFFTESGAANPEDADVPTTMNAGDTALYYATKQNDPNLPNNWYMVPGSESEWNVKLEYPADGIPTITFKDAHIDNSYGFWLGSWSVPSAHDLKIVVESDSIISGGYYCGALNLRPAGNTVTIEGPGKLTMQSNGNSVGWGILACDGNLILDGVDLDITFDEEEWGATNAIAVNGDLTIKDSDVSINGYDMHTAVLCRKNRHTTEEEGGNILVEDSNVTIASFPHLVENVSASAIHADTSITIKDSTFEIGMYELFNPLFNMKPTLEFADNSYTTVATKNKCPQIADDGTMTPVEGKYVDWESTDSLKFITYFKVYPGGDGSSSGVEGNTNTDTDTDTDTNTGTNNSPATGDMNIALVATVAFASALSFAGVTVIGKKRA